MTEKESETKQPKSHWSSTSWSSIIFKIQLANKSSTSHFPQSNP